MGKEKSQFKKNKAVAAADKERALQQKGPKKNIERDRRYTLLVEDFFESKRLQGIMVIGNLHGRVRVGDTMYLYRQDQPVKEVHVLAIELGPREMVETAKDCQVGLCLDLDKEEEVSKYAVVSSIKPVEEALAGRIIENPRLFGLTMEYPRLYTSSVFMDALLYEVCYAKYLIPLYMDRPPLPREGGGMTFSEDTFIGFRSLRKPDDESQIVFPAFTDEVATMLWRDAFPEDQPKQFATMQLPHLIVEVDRGHAGLVINPFGPISVYLPKELLDRVEQSEVFKKRYVRPVVMKQQEETETASEE